MREAIVDYIRPVYTPFGSIVNMSAAAQGDITPKVRSSFPRTERRASLCNFVQGKPRNAQDHVQLMSLDQVGRDNDANAVQEQPTGRLVLVICPGEAQVCPGPRSAHVTGPGRP